MERGLLALKGEAADEAEEWWKPKGDNEISEGRDILENNWKKKKEKQKNKVESDLIRIKSPLQKENFDGSDWCGTSKGLHTQTGRV